MLEYLEAEWEKEEPDASRRWFKLAKVDCEQNPRLKAVRPSISCCRKNACCFLLKPQIIDEVSLLEVSRLEDKEKRVLSIT